MNTLPPSLPSLKYLPAYVVIDGLTGYICGKLSQTNPYLVATVFSIHALAHTLFYHIANYALGGKDLQSQKIFLVTSTLVNMIFLIALKEINVIGRLVSCMLGLAALGYLINRVTYIQEQERQMIFDQIDGLSES